MQKIFKNHGFPVLQMRKGISKFDLSSPKNSGDDRSTGKKVKHDGMLLNTISNREKQILGLVANGMTADEIACSLHLSIDTVETHKKNAVKKLKARNTAHAVAMAVRAGLI